jgi:hypothetical protein
MNYHAAYNSTCPDKCAGGSCELCNGLCSFVVTVSNYSAVMIALMNPQQPKKSHNDADDARAFLKVEAEVRKSAAEDANEAYWKMMADGKMDKSLSGRKEISDAVARQSLLITATHYVNISPAHGEQSGLHNKMKSLEHAKGPSWVCQN